MPIAPRIVGLFAVPLLAAALLAGCATKARVDPAAAIAAAPHPTALASFDGKTGERLSWPTVLERVAAADAVFVGETHDDASAHALEHALVEAFIASHQGAAVSLEFLERDDQAATDKYLAGTITLDEFVEATKSADWAGKGSWLPWYQPMIDSAKRAQAKVVAANAPRKYVSKARTDGYDALRALPADERVLFEIDETISRDGDWERLKALMIEMRIDGSHGDRSEATPTDEEVDQFHRAQRGWDATMGTSAARAQMSGSKVIHVEGAFHIGERLGTVGQFTKMVPTAKVLVINLVPEARTVFVQSDAHGADIVVFTRPPGCGQ